MHVYTLYTAHNMQRIRMYANVFSIAETNAKTNVYNSIQKCSSPHRSKSSSTCNHREGEKDVNYCIHFILHRNICIHLRTFVYIERSDDPNSEVYRHIQCIHKNMYTSAYQVGQSRGQGTCIQSRWSGHIPAHILRGVDNVYIQNVYIKACVYISFACIRESAI